MATPLQSASDAAFKKLPYGMQRIGAPAVLPANGAGSENMRAGVEPGNPVSPLLVKDQADFTNPDYAPQLLRHEQTHRQQANWPEKLQQELPPINSKDPYNYGGVEGIERIGSNPMKLSTEQMASAEQHLQADEQNGSVPEPLKKLDENFQAVPLSVMEPTDPHGKGINTTPRTPGLPMNRPWGTEKLLEADDTIPVEPGSGQAPWEKYASSSASGPWEKYGATPQPEESAPVPTTGRLNMPMHEAEAIQKKNTPIPATSNRDAVANFLPTAGTTLGTGIGTLVIPGLGTAAGGAFGSLVGQRAKERLLGESPDPEAETKATILGAASGPLEDLGEAVPTRAGAGQMFESLKGSLAHAPVPLKSSLDPLQSMAEYGEAGAQLPGPANKLLQRSQATFPMNYPEARKFQETLGTLSRAEREALSGSQGGNLKQLNKGLYDDIHAAASSIHPQYGEQYADAMRDYRNASLLHNGLVWGAKKIPYIAGGAAAAETAHKLLGGR